MNRSGNTRNAILVLGVIIAVALAIVTWVYRERVASIASPLLQKTHSSLSKVANARRLLYKVRSGEINQCTSR